MKQLGKVQLMVAFQEWHHRVYGEVVEFQGGAPICHIKNDRWQGWLAGIEFITKETPDIQESWVLTRRRCSIYGDEREIITAFFDHKPTLEDLQRNLILNDNQLLSLLETGAHETLKVGGWHHYLHCKGKINDQDN